MRQVYLDTAAATPLDPLVERSLSPYLRKKFANPSSLHDPGFAAAKALAVARQRLAAALVSQPDEIIFTAGGTEGNNLAIFGLAGQAPTHLVTTAIEHASVLEPLRVLEKRGWTVSYLPVTDRGLVEPRALAAALKPETRLVSIGLVNSEVGVIQPVVELARVVRKFKKSQTRNAAAKNFPYFHTDACQAPRFVSVAVNRLGVDLLTLNGGKIYGPKGSGVLYCRRGTPLEPLFYGGGQEGGYRSGTENMPGIIGLTRALELCEHRRKADNRRLVSLRDYFIKHLLKLPAVILNGPALDSDPLRLRVANNVNVSFIGLEAEQLVIELAAWGVACSTGSACSTRHPEERHVILALDRSEAAEGRAASAVRFSLDRSTKRADLDYVLKILPPLVKKLRYVSNSFPAL